MTVRPRRPRRSLHDPHALAGEDLVERAGEPGVWVADEELGAHHLLSGDPTADRVGERDELHLIRACACVGENRGHRLLRRLPHASARAGERSHADARDNEAVRPGHLGAACRAPVIALGTVSRPAHSGRRPDEGPLRPDGDRDHRFHGADASIPPSIVSTEPLQ